MLAKFTAMIGVKFKLEDTVVPWEIRSLNENKIIKLAEMKGRYHWLKHHNKHLSRIYPKGTRFDSSNYSPIPGWSTGAQYIALNF